MADVLKITFTGGFEELGQDCTRSLAEPILVGRSRNAQIHLTEEDVSGRHLLITRESDGIWIENLSQTSPTKVNDSPFVTGERRRLAVGDVFSLGRTARFRIDVAGAEQTAKPLDVPLATGATQVVDDETEALDSATAGTRAVQQDETGTRSTRLTENLTRATRVAESQTRATRVAENLTHATRVAETSTRATRAADTFATKAMDDSETAEVMGVAVPLPDSPDSDTGNSKTAREDAETSDRPTDIRPPDEAETTDMRPTGDPSTIGLPTDKTVVVNRRSAEAHTPPDDEHTRPGNKEAWERQLWIRRRRKQLRQLLLAFTSLIFLGMLGVIVWMQWPRKEEFLSVPKVAGTEKNDLEPYTVKSGGENAFVVYFPRDDRQKKTEVAEGAGIEVETFTGRDRDVSFHLKAFATSSADELALSLAESAAAKKAQLAAQEGYVFLSPPAWPAGEFFFESEYPESCLSPRLLRGTRFHRSEYTVTRDGRKWHGAFLLFRDGEMAYQLLHEIPESAWGRGKYLVRNDSNLAFYPAFQAARWESPGRDGFVRDADVPRLLADVTAELDFPQPRVANWPILKRWLDTLMVRTWHAGAAERKRGRALYKRFWKQQDKEYVRYHNLFDEAKKTKDLEKMKSVRDDCRRVFGQDAGDRRFELINNPEKWPCQDE